MRLDEALTSNGVIVESTRNYCLPYLSTLQKLSNDRNCPGAIAVYREAIDLQAFTGLTE
jgi:hypothetical protein